MYAHTDRRTQYELFLYVCACLSLCVCVCVLLYHRADESQWKVTGRNSIGLSTETETNSWEFLLPQDTAKYFRVVHITGRWCIQHERTRKPTHIHTLTHAQTHIHKPADC